MSVCLKRNDYSNQASRCKERKNGTLSVTLKKEASNLKKEFSLQPIRRHGLPYQQCFCLCLHKIKNLIFFIVMGNKIKRPPFSRQSVSFGGFPPLGRMIKDSRVYSPFQCVFEKKKSNQMSTAVHKLYDGPLSSYSVQSASRIGGFALDLNAELAGNTLCRRIFAHVLFQNGVEILLLNNRPLSRALSLLGELRAETIEIKVAALGTRAILKTFPKAKYVSLRFISL